MASELKKYRKENGEIDSESDSLYETVEIIERVQNPLSMQMIYFDSIERMGKNKVP